ncbi:RHS repeat-associated core domain-containing protein [Flavobacterium sp. DGU11]|uniref:RHS repeat-associated core domain-containing protein n=1 Tax=Flavobacterium arundinis TaxID=3139143 RepID=A0ABU9HXR0_9FLAO
MKEKKDYYPFGMLVPERNDKDTADNYRYGFNGKEKDDEWKGNGMQYDYGFRIYDPRIGRFLSTDPLSKSYPWYTPYQFSGNSPIANMDLDGLEEYYYLASWNKKSGKIEFKLQNTVSKKSFLGYEWTPAEEHIVTFISADGDEDIYSFTENGHLTRIDGRGERVNKISSFKEYKKASANKKFESEDKAVRDFEGDYDRNGFFSEGALTLNFWGNVARDYTEQTVMNGTALRYSRGSNIPLSATPEQEGNNNNNKGLVATSGKAGGGAKLEYIAQQTRDRIQAVANKYELEITVVGSRASGKAEEHSDWDYIIKGGNSKSRSSALYQLPKNSKAAKDGDMRPGSEQLTGVEVDNSKPHITFTPNK